MKIREIRDRTDGELRNLVRQLNEDLFKLRVQQATNQLEKTGQFRAVKKDIARTLTVLRSRELGLEGSKADVQE